VRTGISEAPRWWSAKLISTPDVPRLNTGYASNEHGDHQQRQKYERTDNRHFQSLPGCSWYILDILIARFVKDRRTAVPVPLGYLLIAKGQQLGLRLRATPDVTPILLDPVRYNPGRATTTEARAVDAHGRGSHHDRHYGRRESRFLSWVALRLP
jgi:hypothetical protein